MISGIKVGPMRPVVRRRSVLEGRSARVLEVLECGHELRQRKDGLMRTRARCRRCVGMKR